MEQAFDEGSMGVSKNSYFNEEFAYNIRTVFAQTEPRIGKLNNMKLVQHNLIQLREWM